MFYRRLHSEFPVIETQSAIEISERHDQVIICSTKKAGGGLPQPPP